MGYCIDVTIPKFMIKKENIEKALNAINELHTDENLKANAEGGSYPKNENYSIKEQYCYAWVTNPNGNGFKDIREAFEAWRYGGEEDEDGNFVLDEFLGEKQGNCEILFTKIAPYVEDGSEIDYDGEDGWMWRYYFKDGKMIEQSGAVEYN